MAGPFITPMRVGQSDVDNCDQHPFVLHFFPSAHWLHVLSSPGIYGCTPVVEGHCSDQQRRFQHGLDVLHCRGHILHGTPVGTESHGAWWPNNRGAFSSFSPGVLSSAVAMFKLELGIMNYFWDAAYVGGQNEASFGWRYSHTTTMAAFILVPAIMLNYLFSKAFDRMGVILKGAVMSLISIVIGSGFAWVYYAAGPTLLRNQQWGFPPLRKSNRLFICSSSIF